MFVQGLGRDAVRRQTQEPGYPLHARLQNPPGFSHGVVQTSVVAQVFGFAVKDLVSQNGVTKEDREYHQRTDQDDHE